MANSATAGPDPRWTDALLAATLFAIDPAGIPGILLAGAAGPARDTWLQHARSLWPETAPWRKLPAQIPDSRLLGGLDLVATLQAGRPVVERGLLAETNQGVLVLPMAERLPTALIARVLPILDDGELTIERDGLALAVSTRFGVIACDESRDDDARPPTALLDRLALAISVDGLRHDVDAAGWPGRDDVAAARGRLPAVVDGDGTIEALCAATLAFGIASARVPLFALRVARAAAALFGREVVSAEDVAIAGRLVLAPRATQVPQLPDDHPDEPAPPPPEQTAGDDATTRPDPAESPAGADTTPPAESDRAQPVEALQDQTIAAVRASLPDRLLAMLAGGAVAGRSSQSGRGGPEQHSPRRGRPAGVRKGLPRAGAALNVIATLRAAAPWQRLRQPRGAAAERPRIQVRVDDFHVTRHRERIGTTTVFVLDASGSTALQRFGEAKGAVELLLAECYVRRDQVAVLAFRGRTAEVLLPPTRSLVRAKRSLSALPGGGGTPLAAGIDAATVLAESLRRRGTSPSIVLLTDGRGNVARDGSTGRAVAEQDALAAARRLAASRVSSLLIDTSPRPQPQAHRLAAAMGAPYVPLPQASPAAVAAAVQAAQSTRRDRR